MTVVLVLVLLVLVLVGAAGDGGAGGGCWARLRGGGNEDELGRRPRAHAKVLAGAAKVECTRVELHGLLSSELISQTGDGARCQLVTK